MLQGSALACCGGTHKMLKPLVTAWVFRYAWWSPQPRNEGSWDSGTGPNALYYGTGNKTYLTGLGKIYLERLGLEAASCA